jgi:hypothetical protein
MNINNQLENLYAKNISGVSELENLELDGPLLMHCWEKEYLNSNFKILFIGQETYSWAGDIVTDINNEVNRYKQFVNMEVSTPFWNCIYRINEQLNQNQNNNFQWTNISKFCNVKPPYPLSFDVHTKTVEHFNVLKEEIEILKPDVIIFFSGHSYDDKIEIQFKENLEFLSVFDEIPKIELARIKGSCLPEHTYRTYHPNYLQRSKKKYIIDFLLSKIRDNKDPEILCITKHLKKMFGDSLKVNIQQYNDGRIYAEYYFKPYKDWLELWIEEDCFELWFASYDKKDNIEILGKKYDFYSSEKYGRQYRQYYKTNIKFDYHIDNQKLLEIVLPILKELSKYKE